ncbi:MAG: hypothetical protein R2708_17220 [Vicinamibacterales bacterium]
MSKSACQRLSPPTPAPRHSRLREIPSELSQIYRQYCGVKANPRQIQILFAHRSSPDAGEWLRGQPLGVFDGGEYYFEVTYEVATGRFGSLSVNTNF